MLRSGRDYQGFPDDRNDYFVFRIATGGPVIIDLSNHTGQGTQVQLYYESTANLVSFDAEPPFHIGYNAAIAGRYFIRIVALSGYNNSTAYTLRATFP